MTRESDASHNAIVQDLNSEQMSWKAQLSTVSSQNFATL